MANKLNLNPFSGGMNVRTSPLIIKDNEAELLLNYNLDKLGAATRRNGYTIGPTNLTAGKNVVGMYQFIDSSAGTSIALCAQNDATDANTVTYSSPTASSGAWTARDNRLPNTKARFFTFVDYVFITNGASVVGSSANGTAWGTTNCPTVITPKFGAVFQDRAYVSNGGSSTSSRLWYSSLPSAGAITWDTTNDWIDINPDDGDQITALENNGNRLLIFKNRALYRWMFGQVEPDRLIGVGTSSQESVKTNFDVGITFFANPLGVYAYTTGRPKLISRKIQAYVDAVTDWTNVFAEVDDDHYYLAVGNITVFGRTFTNAMFVYQVSLDAWYLYTFSVPVKWMARMFTTAPKMGVFFGSNTDATYVFNSGTSDVNSAGSAVSIPSEAVTKEYVVSFPERANLIWVDVFALPNVEVSTFFDLDHRNEFGFGDLGALTQRVTNFRVPNRECNTVRLKFADNSQDISVIEGYNLEFEPKQKRDEMTVNIKRRTNG